MPEPVEMDDWDADEPRFAPARERDRDREARPLFWPVWLWPLLAWAPLDAWHQRLARDWAKLDSALIERAPAPAEVMAWIATGGVLLAAAGEAAFYGMLWAARGRKLPFLATTVAVLQAGVLELLALRLIESPVPAPWAAILAGPRATAGGAAGALVTAFGSAGVLALARCVLIAGLQAGLLRRRWREVFVIVCAAWLASHVALWWGIELFRGRSLFGGGG